MGSSKCVAPPPPLLLLLLLLVVHLPTYPHKRTNPRIHPSVTTTRTHTHTHTDSPHFFFFFLLHSTHRATHTPPPPQIQPPPPLQARAEKEDRLRNDERFLKRMARKIMQKAQSMPEVLVGWVLATTDPDGSNRDALCIGIVQKRGRPTRHVLRYADTGEALVALRRKEVSTCAATRTDEVLSRCTSILTRDSLLYL